MNRWALLTAISVVSVMALVMPHPAWLMVLALGIGANVIVIAANGWKMPVRGKCEETLRHQPMTPETRHKWLADVIPIGIGKASIGDFLLVAGLLGNYRDNRRFIEHASYAYHIVALIAVVWFIGWVKGFRVSEKWLPDARREFSKNLILSALLLAIGNMLGMHGCSVSDVAASVSIHDALAPPHRDDQHISKTPLRSLGEIAPPPFQTLTRLKMEAAKRSAELRKQDRLRARTEAQLAVNQFVPPRGFLLEPKPRTRSGPFCHVTCTAHHDAHYDRETIPEFCRANWIPPEAIAVPGWWPIDDKREYTAAWPGPATPGFHSYKLYWKETP